MNEAVRQILGKDNLTRHDLVCIINKTYELYGTTNAQFAMRDALVGMANNGILFWTIQHFLRECAHNDWNLAPVFAEDPRLFLDCLINGDMGPYFANYPPNE